MSQIIIAQEPDSTSALFRLCEAERNFAKQSAMFGKKTAFINNFNEESVFFDGKWVTNGLQKQKESKEHPFILKWEPEFIDISKSQDFGISTGPWESQEYRPYTEPTNQGYYLSVWQKQSDGIWKVILDVGILTPRHKNHKHSIRFPKGADLEVENFEKIDKAQSEKELIAKEKELFTTWSKKHSHIDYLSFFSKDAMKQLGGYLPTRNMDTIKAQLKNMDKTLIWKTNGSGAAPSGDIGFTYGIYEKEDSPDKTKGYFVRIWKREPEMDWRISIELSNFF